MGSLMAGWDSPVLGDDKKGISAALSILAENAPHFAPLPMHARNVVREYTIHQVFLCV
jgi:hypothetical protein